MLQLIEEMNGYVVKLFNLEQHNSHDIRNHPNHPEKPLIWMVFGLVVFSLYTSLKIRKHFDWSAIVNNELVSKILLV